MASIYRWYNTHLIRRPVLTQCITTAFLFAAGDSLAQHTVERKPVREHDYARTCRFSAFGGALAGPLLVTWYCLLHIPRVEHPVFEFLRASKRGFTRRGYWAQVNGRYRILERYVTVQNLNAKVLVRVGLDQLIFAPPNIVVFFTAQSLMEGETPQEIQAKLKRTYTTTLVNNWKVWPFVQLINFKFVPLNYRLLVVNTVALGWNCYLSVMNTPPRTGQDVKETLPLFVE